MATRNLSQLLTHGTSGVIYTVSDISHSQSITDIVNFAFAGVHGMGAYSLGSRFTPITITGTIQATAANVATARNNISGIVKQQFLDPATNSAAGIGDYIAYQYTFDLVSASGDPLEIYTDSVNGFKFCMITGYQSGTRLISNDSSGWTVVEPFTMTIASVMSTS